MVFCGIIKLYIVKVSIFYMRLSVVTSRFSLVGSFLFIFLVGLVGSVSAQGTAFPGATDLGLAGTLSNVGRGTEVLAILVNVLTGIAVSLAFLFFFWNLFQYIRQGEDEQKAKAKHAMGYSVIAMVVVTSLWGIISYVRDTAGIGSGDEVKGTVFIPITEFASAGGWDCSPVWTLKRGCKETSNGAYDAIEERACICTKSGGCGEAEPTTRRPVWDTEGNCKEGGEVGLIDEGY